MSFHYNYSSLRNSTSPVWLLTPRPPAELFPLPWSQTSSSFSVWEHKQTLFLLLSFWEVSGPDTVPGSSHSQSAASGLRVTEQWWLQSVKLESQDVEVQCLGAESENSLEKSKRLRPWSPASSFLLFQDGKNKPCTQTNTRPASPSNKWQGLGAGI